MVVMVLICCLPNHITSFPDIHMFISLMSGKAGDKRCYYVSGITKCKLIKKEKNKPYIKNTAGGIQQQPGYKMMGFNIASTSQELFYTLGLGNHIHHMFIFTFFV